MKILFAQIFFTLLLLGCSQQEFSYPQRQMPADLLSDRDGLTAAAATFRRNCAYCHGHVDEGRGERADFFDPPAPDFFAGKYRMADPAYLFWRISEGKTTEPFLSQGSVMPAWGPHYTDRQIWLLVIYLQQRPVSR